ncbi:MAG TPA: amidohydrolase family protein [Xanthomonadaceae bacterium]|jgi:imidazolonepropionase-like amidohydrolase
MQHKALAAALCLALAAPAFAQTPSDQLAKPPADAQHFVIVSASAKHGTSDRWIAADGTRMGRDSFVLRGQVFDTDSATHLGSDGMIDRMVMRGHTPNGDAAETFAIKNGTAAWKSPVDSGSAPYRGPADYAAFGGTNDAFADLLETLIASADHSLAMLPGGRMHVEVLTSVTVGDGPQRKKVIAYAVTGFSNEPIPVWTDESGHFFASVSSLSTILSGYESAVPQLQKAQDDALSLRVSGLPGQLEKTPAGPVAFAHVRAFLDGTHFADDQTVVVDHGTIAQVGPASAIKVPAGAQVFDGHGRTLVPGLWDAHQHFGDDFSGPALLSLGITSVRDPGNVTALTLARAQRRAKGELLSPRVYPSMLLDGKGPNTAQVGSAAGSLDEALAIVRKAKADGFIAIKFYGTFNPAWVKPVAAEAHRLGMHVHGHLPAGMRTSQAIDDGYDEITHIYFVMMEAMPDSVVKVSNGMARFEGPGRYAKDVDLDAEPMKSLIAKMAQRHIAADPTLVVAEGLYVPENGDLSPEYAPFTGTLPPAVERGFRAGGFAPPQGVTRADYRASFAKLEALVGKLHQAGVPIVAGTDGSGMELVRELELYVDAGFTTSEALASATIATAHLVGADARTGSIALGKAADLVLVDGNPEQHIGDLRHTKVVMMDGKLMDADALRAAGGFAGAPKFEE